jgi:hypothetical protein
MKFFRVLCNFFCVIGLGACWASKSVIKKVCKFLGIKHRKKTASKARQLCALKTELNGLVRWLYRNLSVIGQLFVSRATRTSVTFFLFPPPLFTAASKRFPFFLLWTRRTLSASKLAALHGGITPYTLCALCCARLDKLVLT